MKDTFMMKFNELDSLCKTIFPQETLDFKSIRVFSDTLSLEYKSLLLNIISIRNILTHSKISLMTVNEEAIDVLEGFIEGLKRSRDYDLKYVINPLIEKKKTAIIAEIKDMITIIETGKIVLDSQSLKNIQDIFMIV